MDKDENNSSQRKKQKQATLDSFLNVLNKPKIENDSSSLLSIDSLIESENELQDTETRSGSYFNHLFNDTVITILNNCYTKDENRDPLLAPLTCVKYLLRQGFEINDHEMYIGFLELLTECNESIDENMVKNALLVKIDLINSCAEETTKSILKDVNDGYFAILVDEYSDKEGNDQIVLCLRYVDDKGDVIERFLGVTIVVDNSSLSLKNSVYYLLEKHSLSISNIRGQGYNGFSNMQGDIYGLKNLIMEENQSAYYLHCFAHQLESTLVEISTQKVDCVGSFFYKLEYLSNVVGVQWKGSKISEDIRFQEVSKVFVDCKIEIENRLNEKVDDGFTGPYYKLVSSVIDFYPEILDMLDMIEDNNSRSFVRFEYGVACDAIESFDFFLMAHLMKIIFEVTNELNNVLHKKGEEIVNAMSLVKSVKERLQKIRDDEWENLLSSVISFCDKNEIKVPNMYDMYIPFGRYKEDEPDITNLHHFRVDEFLTMVDYLLHELNDRFDAVNMELLICMGSLSPIDSFRSFDKQKLLKLAGFYPNEFSTVDLVNLDNQLDNYIHEMRNDERFMGLKDLKELSKKLVEVNKHEGFNLVYLLIKLVLILPIVTPSVERAFWVMKYVKSELHKNISDELLNHRLVTYIEQEVFSKISDDDILTNFKSMKL